MIGLTFKDAFGLGLQLHERVPGFENNDQSGGNI